MKRAAAILAVLLLLCALAVGCQSKPYTLASGVYYPEGVAPEDLIGPSISINGEEFRLSLNPLMSYAIFGTVSRSGNEVTLDADNAELTMQFQLIGDNKLKLTSDASEQTDGTVTDGMEFILRYAQP